MKSPRPLASFRSRPSRASSPLPSPALHTSFQNLLVFYCGVLKSEHEELERRLRRDAGLAARRGDQGARAFLADLSLEQAA